VIADRGTFKPDFGLQQRRSNAKAGAAPAASFWSALAGQILLVPDVSIGRDKDIESG
jgi:hypothetical protein